MILIKWSRKWIISRSQVDIWQKIFFVLYIIWYFIWFVLPKIQGCFHFLSTSMTQHVMVVVWELRQNQGNEEMLSPGKLIFISEHLCLNIIKYITGMDIVYIWMGQSQVKSNETTPSNHWLSWNKQGSEWQITSGSTQLLTERITWGKVKLSFLKHKFFCADSPNTELMWHRCERTQTILILELCPELDVPLCYCGLRSLEAANICLSFCW